MKQRGNWYTVLLIIILIASLIMLILENIPAVTGNAPANVKKTPLTGYATEGSTWSNVSISYYLAIQMNANLSSGIDFGNVISLPAWNINASGNNNGTDMSNFTINVSTDSNTAVDFCIRATEALKDRTGNLATIGLGNETYSGNVTFTNISYPAMASEAALTTGYVEAASPIPIGNSTYWRFWLDIPAGQAAGNYNNTVWFKGITTSTSC